MIFLISRKLLLTVVVSMFFANAMSQSEKVNFDVKSSFSGGFNSAKDLSETFVKYFFNEDSTNYQVFYSTEVLCLLYKEEIENNPNSKMMFSEGMCADSTTQRVFEYTVNRKRIQFLKESDNILYKNILIESLNVKKRKSEPISKYKFELYNIYLIFLDKLSNKKFVLKLFDVYHINYKWFILDPSFEILPE